ncbi:chaplin, partial [Streptomyces sp. SID11385]|uniref:chaplin n=1 Tax=Streptomyces sp. SID11385 TaxID=2706031 RepID=UPI0013CDDCB0
MRHTLGTGMLVTAAAASGILSLNGGSALAAEPTAAGSPGILSGNSVQAPVTIPVNICGNSVDAAGIGNPAFGNGCGTDGGASAGPAVPREQEHERGHEQAGPERAKPGRHAAPGPVREAGGHEARGHGERGHEA